MSGQAALEAVWRMKWLVMAVILVFVGVSAAVTASLPRIYEATAIVRVVPPEQGADASSFSQVQSSQALARTYAELFKSRNVFEAAVERGDPPVSPSSLASATTVSHVEGTELIEVRVEDSDPNQASSLADLLANTFIAERDTSGGESLVLADPAPLPAQPVRPSLPLNLALALLLGSIVAVGGALLLNFYGDRVSSPEEIEELVGAPILGSLPRTEGDANSLRGSATFQEAIRAVRTNLNFALGSSSGEGVFLVTSALPREGKTTVSGALAVSYALAGHECIVVDADLRRPQIHTRFLVRNLRGLSETLLERPVDSRKPISTLEDVPNLAVLTSGAIPPNPVDLLSSEGARELIQDLRERYNTVVMDTPPALALVDASVVASQTDGVVLVLDSREARRRNLLRVVDQLRSGKGRILGVVLNFVPEKEVTYYYAYEQYSG